MLGSRTYYVCILTNKSGTLYTGVTGNLKRRVWQHKTKEVKGFTQKYNIDRLIYYETFGDVWSAIAREKQIKGWVRRRKLELIASMNAEWHDLSDGWYDTSCG
jgi:putative endonuclease